MRKFLFWLMPVLYIVAGIYHFINPSFYMQLMPHWMPEHLLLVQISGVIEILLGLGLIPKQTRIISAWFIVAMLIVFFFAIHIPMAIQFYHEENKNLWIALIRLPIQFYLIWWAMKFTRKRIKN
ncbi:DoxX family membrane protein [soil metagenome]